MSLWSRIKAAVRAIYFHPSSEEQPMADEAVVAAAAAQPVAVAPVAATVAPVAAEPAPAAVVADVAPVAAVELNTDKLKAILTVLGHDLEAVWEDAIALAKKAL